MKRKYYKFKAWKANPFKLWGSWILGILGLILGFFIGVLGLALGCGYSYNHCSIMDYMGVAIPTIIFFVIGFFIGWAINSIWRKFYK